MGRAALGALLLIGMITAYAAWISWTVSGATPSTCFGRTAAGRLEHAKRLPAFGENYRAYSGLLWLIGRASMHGDVRDVVESAYATLARTDPELRFVYGEVSWPWGGKLWPHRTHQNGLSVDFFVPVRDRDGTVDEVPNDIFNRWGYDARFDNRGRNSAQSIDFDALAKHLAAISSAAKARGVGISIVILENELRQLLLSDPVRRVAVAGLRFSQRRAWVRHDNHYHIDFVVRCKGVALRGLFTQPIPVPS